MSSLGMQDIIQYVRVEDHSLLGQHLGMLRRVFTNAPVELPLSEYNACVCVGSRLARPSFQRRLRNRISGHCHFLWMKHNHQTTTTKQKPSTMSSTKKMPTGAVLLAPSPAHQEEKYDFMYYLKGAAAGGICCSVTHGALTPVDVVKTRVQLDPAKVCRASTESALAKNLCLFPCLS